MPGDGTDSKGRAVAAKPAAARPRTFRRDCSTASRGENSIISSADSSFSILCAERILVFADGKTNALAPPPDAIAQDRATSVVFLMLLMFVFLTNGNLIWR